MWWPFSARGRAQPPADTRWRIRALFQNFRRILACNTQALERMAEMDQALGGAYIFDRAFLESSVHELSRLVHHVVYNLNALTGNGYVALYDRYEELRGALGGVLAGGMDGGVAVAQSGAGETTRNVADMLADVRDVDWEQEPTAGFEAACLARLARHHGARIADALVVGTVGCAVLGDGGPTADAAGRELHERAVRMAGGAASFTLRVNAVDETGRPTSPETERTGVAPDMLPHMLRDTVREAVTNDEVTGDAGTGHATVALILPEFPLPVSGWLHSHAPMGPVRHAVLVEARFASGDGAEHAPRVSTDRYALSRVHPFDLLCCEIPQRAANAPLPDGSEPLAPSASLRGLLRGSALLEPPFLQGLAGLAMAAERLAGQPVELRWGMDPEGRCVLLGVRPSTVRLATDPQDQPEEPADSEDNADDAPPMHVLRNGGQTVQMGVAAGGVVRLTEATRPEDCPLGGIGVARAASPNLAPLLGRLAGLVTEFGTTAGHLATVARELRVPAVFGMPGVCDAARPGDIVTLDAGGTVLYRGAVEGLLHTTDADEDLHPAAPEYRTLRRLLRLVAPLDLVDPDAPDFSPAGCRTYHDILHFCHEMSVEALINLRDTRPELAAPRVHRVRLDLPLDLRLLDVGDGVAGPPGRPDGAGSMHGGDAWLDLTAVRSAPLLAFLDGLRAEGAWSHRPARLRAGDILSGMGGASGTAANGAGPDAEWAATGANLAIAGRDYLNLTLRLGYHFTVLDVLLSDNPNRNHAYFRFAGGMADPARRVRRAHLVGNVLEELGFATRMRGDMVTGRLRAMEHAALRDAVAALGMLTAFTRQVDTTLNDDADMVRAATNFRLLRENAQRHTRG
ncbi:PEP-utilizing enzyme [Nitratidesulfovibrio sp.]|uniref:PEP-utilizing enzyme n=1 Tax=Nitratidesulfovibrio sp. TaxID=2802297 RepID=UPI00334144CE